MVYRLLHSVHAEGVYTDMHTGTAKHWWSNLSIYTAIAIVHSQS